MSDFRRERIEKLLQELRYEIERGVMQREIGEEMTFGFIIPVSNKLPNGVVRCEFRMRPMLGSQVPPDDFRPKLKVVGDD